MGGIDSVSGTDVIAVGGGRTHNDRGRPADKVMTSEHVYRGQQKHNQPHGYQKPT